MHYIFMVVVLAYGILNIRYASAKQEEIPPSLRFLLPQKMVDFLIFIPMPNAKRVMITRLITGIGTVLVIGSILFASIFLK